MSNSALSGGAKSSELSTAPLAEAVERVLITGDLTPLTPEQRVHYYNRVCESTGLNPYTQPFDYLILNGKTVLYARKNCAEQLRKVHGISVTKLDGSVVNGCAVVRCYVRDKTGREDAASGVVDLEGLRGERYANALMKAETKAKRRATLSLCGLGMLDETEVETIPAARTERANIPTEAQAYADTRRRGQHSDAEARKRAQDVEVETTPAVPVEEAEFDPEGAPPDAEERGAVNSEALKDLDEQLRHATSAKMVDMLFRGWSNGFADMFGDDLETKAEACKIRDYHLGRF